MIQVLAGVNTDVLEQQQNIKGAHAFLKAVSEKVKVRQRKTDTYDTGHDTGIFKKEKQQQPESK